MAEDPFASTKYSTVEKLSLTHALSPHGAAVIVARYRFPCPKLRVLLASVRCMNWKRTTLCMTRQILAFFASLSSASASSSFRFPFPFVVASALLSSTLGFFLCLTRPVRSRAVFAASSILAFCSTGLSPNTWPRTPLNGFASGAPAGPSTRVSELGSRRSLSYSCQ